MQINAKCILAEGPMNLKSCQICLKRLRTKLIAVIQFITPATNRQRFAQFVLDLNRKYGKGRCSCLGLICVTKKKYGMDRGGKKGFLVSQKHHLLLGKTS